MEPQLLTLYRHALLRQLSAALPASLTSETLLLGLTAAGFSTTLAELQTELLYLTQKDFIEAFTKPLSPATSRYRLSSTGRDYLMSENL